MRHDIYSIGVCLLEIGLWKSFVKYCPDNSVTPGVSEIKILPIQDQTKRAFDLKRMFVELAKEKLPSRMGDRFIKVVILCLTCLDKDSAFGLTKSQSDDDDGVALGVQYIQKVCTPGLPPLKNFTLIQTDIGRYRGDLGMNDAARSTFRTGEWELALSI